MHENEFDRELAVKIFKATMERSKEFQKKHQFSAFDKRVVSKNKKENHIVGRVESSDPDIAKKIKKAIHRMNRQGTPISYDLIFVKDSVGKMTCDSTVS